MVSWSLRPCVFLYLKSVATEKGFIQKKNQDSRVAANVTAEDLIIKLRGLNETIFGSELDRLD